MDVIRCWSCDGAKGDCACENPCGDPECVGCKYDRKEAEESWYEQEKEKENK